METAGLDTLVYYLQHGHLGFSYFQLFLYFIFTTGITLFAISCYLHRSQTHRAVDFVWPIAIVFRTILWLFTGIVVKEWVSVHRKHHAHCDSVEDPHSPRHHGLSKILLKGADIYQGTAKNNPQLLIEYGVGTQNDWLERNVFSNGPLGILITFVVEVFLFGLPGIAVWAAQMTVMPVIAAGFINGVAHVFGYQTYTDGDMDEHGKLVGSIGDARNVPTYLIAVGEEFHNNHHAFQGRYKFSHQWYEFDVAGTFIEILVITRLARVPE